MAKLKRSFCFFAAFHLVFLAIFLAFSACGGGGGLDPIPIDPGTGIPKTGGGSPTPPSITTPSLPGGVINVPYTQPLLATGTAPITWSIVSGSLPPGLSHSGGTISGTPSATGTFTFTVKAANGTGSDTKSLSIEIASSAVAPAITTVSLPDGTAGVPYSQTIGVTGTAPIWSISSGTLGLGLSLDTATGTISGTPTGGGILSFTVKAENTAGSDSKAFSITINTLTVTFATNGGTTVSPITGIVSGTTIAAPAAPSTSAGGATMNRFRGWYTDDGTFASAFNFSTPITASITLYADWGYRIGDAGPGGGKVFFRADGVSYMPGVTPQVLTTNGFDFYTDTGATKTTKYYLEAAPAEWRTGISPDPKYTWGEGIGWYMIPGLSQNETDDTDWAIGRGMKNTKIILGAPPAYSYVPAAYNCDTYTSPAGAGDWFLPSKDELNVLCNVNAAGRLSDAALANGYYWSSSQHSEFPSPTNYLAWARSSTATGFLGYSKTSLTIYVRPIRAF